MVHGGLPSLKILFHMIVLANLYVRFKDDYKARINASKKLYQENSILENMPSDNPKIQRS